MTDQQESRDLRSCLPWISGLLLMSALLAFLPAFFGRTVVDSPSASDLGYQWIPFSKFIMHCYSIGHFPLWDPHNLCGMPFLAFPHTGSLYLPWVFTHLLFKEYALGGAIDIFMHLCLASFSTFAMFRFLGRSHVTGFCAAVAYAFSGFIFANIAFAPTLHTGAWLPLWFGGSLLLLARPGLTSFLIPAFAFAAMLYGGDMEMLVFGVLGLVFELALRRGEERAWPGYVALAGSLAAGSLLALPQLLPTFEFVHQSVRSGGFSPSLSMAPVALAFLMALFQLPRAAQYFPPNHGLDPYYLGAFLILLAAYGSRRHGYVRKRLLIFPAAVVYLMFIYAHPFSLVGSRIPVLGSLVVPMRMWPVVTLFFLMATGFSLDRWLLQDGKTDRAFLPGGRWGGAFLLAFGIATAVSLHWISRGMTMRIVFCALFMATGTAALLFPGKLSRMSARSRAGLAVCLVVLDLYGLALSWEPMTKPQDLAPDRGAMSLISGTAPEQRYMILSSRGILDTDLPFNLGLLTGADTIDCWTRIPPKDAARRLSLLYPSIFKYKDGRLKKFDQMAVRDPDNLDKDRLGLLNRMNVVWILARYALKLNGPSVRIIPWESMPGLYLYRNLSAMPRAYTGLKGEQIAWGVRRPFPDVLLLERPASLDTEDTSIYTSESWRPGWRAYLLSGMRKSSRPLETREIKILKDHLAFRFLKLERPDKEEKISGIKMVFKPPGFKLGLWACLASLASVLCFLIFKRPERFRKGESTPLTKQHTLL